jgi:N utilization substance protein B
MPNRRRARELAMQALFAVEIGQQDPSEAIANLVSDNADSDTRVFVKNLVFGSIEFSKTSDEIIIPLLQDWTLDRIPHIDRVILRMAIYELYKTPETPRAVVLNEAVELAKIFSTENSGRFVNGVLANVNVNGS